LFTQLCRPIAKILAPTVVQLFDRNRPAHTGEVAFLKGIKSGDVRGADPMRGAGRFFDACEEGMRFIIPISPMRRHRSGQTLSFDKLQSMAVRIACQETFDKAQTLIRQRCDAGRHDTPEWTTQFL
jgi:hypothetical protein